MLNKNQIKFLRTLAHDRTVILWVGQHGLSKNVMEEINNALNHHELVKMKIRVGDRDSRDEVIETICEKTGADKVQTIGNVLVLYRQNKEKPGITLPK